MFAITKAGKERKEYVRSIRRIMAEVFNLSFLDIYRQNKIWEEWLGLKKECEPRDLRALLNSNVNDVFKARAIAILLVPKIKLAPFMWNGDKRSPSTNYLSQDIPVLSKLSPQLQAFTIKLLGTTIDIALEPDANEEIRETLSTYNGYILQALVILPENDPRAVEMFRRYQIRDPIAFDSMFDDCSGYDPFRNILASSVPEKWKRLADEKMQEIICAEEEGRAQPREKWEKALIHYIDSIKVCSFRSGCAYSLDLLASQIEFVLNLHSSKLGRLVDFNIYTLLATPNGQERKELRHKIARHAMLTKDSGIAYSVLDAERLTNALKILDDFGNDDMELGDWLREIIAEEKIREQNKASGVSESQARISVVIAKMK